MGLLSWCCWTMACISRYLTGELGKSILQVKCVCLLQSVHYFKHLKCFKARKGITQISHFVFIQFPCLLSARIWMPPIGAPLLTVPLHGIRVGILARLCLTPLNCRGTITKEIEIRKLFISLLKTFWVIYNFTWNPYSSLRRLSESLRLIGSAMFSATFNLVTCVRIL